jgi:hypothetical protein
MATVEHKHFGISKSNVITELNMEKLNLQIMLSGVG